MAMNILGIETSCDETSAAVVRNGKTVLSSVVFTQIDLHRPYGGVVPEVACRCHVETLPGVICEAVNRSGLDWGGIDGVAVTYGPGLASSLLVGVSAAKALALRLGKPLCAVNHLEGHLYSAFLDEDAPSMESVSPFVALIVSGGHTCLVRVEAPGRYVLLGQTVDDAAGEAFDKGAKLLGLGYPGGPAVDRCAAGGDPGFVRFPRGRQGDDMPRGLGLDPELCFSFSGLKTALLYHLKRHPLVEGDERLASLAASYQEAIVSALNLRCERALESERCLAVCGGVSMNRSLRERLAQTADRMGVRLLLSKPRYCADNAAMVAGAAGLGLCITGDAAMQVDVDPGLPIVHVDRAGKQNDPPR